MTTPTPTPVPLAPGAYLPTFLGSVLIRSVDYEDTKFYGRVPVWAKSGSGLDTRSWAVGSSTVAFATPEDAEAYREARLAALARAGDVRR